MPRSKKHSSQGASLHLPFVQNIYALYGLSLASLLFILFALAKQRFTALLTFLLSTMVIYFFNRNIVLVLGISLTVSALYMLSGQTVEGFDISDLPANYSSESYDEKKNFWENYCSNHPSEDVCNKDYCKKNPNGELCYSSFCKAYPLFYSCRKS